jgi:hypothetical protein
VITNRQKVEEFQRQYARENPLSYEQALAIYEAMFREAVALGAVSSENIMDGVEKNIRLAKALNSLEKKWNS